MSKIDPTTCDVLFFSGEVSNEPENTRDKNGERNGERNDERMVHRDGSRIFIEFLRETCCATIVPMLHRNVTNCLYSVRVTAEKNQCLTEQFIAQTFCKEVFHT